MPRTGSPDIAFHLPSVITIIHPYRIVCFPYPLKPKRVPPSLFLLGLRKGVGYGLAAVERADENEQRAAGDD